MLVGKHRGGYKHGSLLSVGSGLECRAYGNLGFSEANIAAHEAVHGALALHVGLDGLRGRELVGRVFIDERRLQLVLHVAVRGKGVAALLLSVGIQAYEVAGDVLEFALCALLHAVPRSGAYPVHLWRHTLLATVFGKLVQRVYAHEDDVVVGIHEFYHLLRAASHIGAQQTGEAPYAVVHVHNEVAWLYLPEFLERKSHAPAARAVAFEGVFVEAVEYLMVGEHTHACGMVHEPLVQRAFHGSESDVVASVGKNGTQALELPLVVA